MLPLNKEVDFLGEPTPWWEIPLIIIVFITGAALVIAILIVAAIVSSTLFIFSSSFREWIKSASEDIF